MLVLLLPSLLCRDTAVIWRPVGWVASPALRPGAAAGGSWQGSSSVHLAAIVVPCVMGGVLLLAGGWAGNRL